MQAFTTSGSCFGSERKSLKDYADSRNDLALTCSGWPLAKACCEGPGVCSCTGVSDGGCIAVWGAALGGGVICSVTLSGTCAL